MGVLDRQPVLFIGQPGKGQRLDGAREVQPPSGWGRRRRPGGARQAVLLRAVSGDPQRTEERPSTTVRIPTQAGYRAAERAASERRPAGIEPAGGPSKDFVPSGHVHTEPELPEPLRDHGQRRAGRDRTNQSEHRRSEHLSQRPGAGRLPLGGRRQPHGPLLAEQSERQERDQQRAVRLAVRRQSSLDRHQPGGQHHAHPFVQDVERVPVLAGSPQSRFSGERPEQPHGHYRRPVSDRRRYQFSSVACEQRVSVLGHGDLDARATRSRSVPTSVTTRWTTSRRST